jgi:hypothetical protein
MTARAGMDESDRDLFVLRWGEEEEWGHLAASTGPRKPVFVGFVWLDCDPTFQALTREYSIAEDGMREVWFSGSDRRRVQG